jgi:uncharacterized protein (DUF1697 family)
MSSLSGGKGKVGGRAAPQTPAFVALLRAVNVGGTGKLAMADLASMCRDLGFSAVRTYIASGNVVFHSALSGAAVKRTLEARLLDFAGRPVGVMVRDAAEMAGIVAANPFPDAPGNRIAVIFLDGAASKEMLLEVAGQAGELLHVGLREIYVHYPQGMATTKLRIPAAKSGTARNMNTVKKLSELALA